jgi:hypothetical protein
MALAVGDVEDLRLVASALNSLGNVMLIQGQADTAQGYYFDT